MSWRLNFNLCFKKFVLSFSINDLCIKTFTGESQNGAVKIMRHTILLCLLFCLTKTDYFLLKLYMCMFIYIYKMITVKISVVEKLPNVVTFIQLSSLNYFYSYLKKKYIKAFYQIGLYILTSFTELLPKFSGNLLENVIKWE